MFRRGGKKEPRKENKLRTMCSAVYRHFSFLWKSFYIFYKNDKFRVLLLPSFERNFLLLVVVFILRQKTTSGVLVFPASVSWHNIIGIIINILIPIIIILLSSYIFSKPFPTTTFSHPSFTPQLTKPFRSCNNSSEPYFHISAQSSSSSF